MRLILSNKQGLFNSLGFNVILTVTAFNHLTQLLKDNVPSNAVDHPPLNEKQKEKLTEYLNLVQKLPQETGWVSSMHRYDFKDTKMTNTRYAHIKSFGFYAESGRFVGGRQICNIEYNPEQIRQTWEVVREISQIKGIDPLLEFLGCYFKRGSELRRFCQKAQDWKLEEENLTEILSQASSFAIYLHNPNNPSGGGYLDAHGYTVQSLASARMFESAAAAKNTIGSRRLRGGVVVEVESYLKGLVQMEGMPAINDIGNLRFGLASAEKKNLTESLNEMEIESKLAELETIKQEHPEWFESKEGSSIKRRI